MKLLKGTTNIGFISKGCIIIGVDSRISSVRHDRYIIDSDTERKYFEFSSKANIVCTFMGLAYDWDAMYQYVKEKDPTSVKEAVEFAQKYMNKYKEMHHDAHMFKYSEEYDEEVSFGTLIAGYDEQEGFQLYRLHLMQDKELKDTVASLGSGGWIAQRIVMDVDYKHMTKKDSVDLAYKALLESTIMDPYSGGEFNVMHVRKNGFSIAAATALDVYYRFYDVLNINQRTLFLIYPGAQRDEILGDELIQSIWPNGEVVLQEGKQSHLCHVDAAHLVAQKRYSTSTVLCL